MVTEIKRSIKLSIKKYCDFCDSKQIEHVYTPIRSARGMEVYLCRNCGLVQSMSTASYQSRPPGSMSCDADRSSYRYTKDVISNRYEECFSEFIDFSKIDKVLDVGSNRGAFINYLQSKYPGKSITAIEPDSSVTVSYSSLANVELQECRFEHARLDNDNYDFVYCAHTLEHADSARTMLSGIRDALKPGGLFFLAVPNLIFFDDVIEELFIDPHTFHFKFEVLRDFVQRIGFEVVYEGGSNDPDAVFLLKKNLFDVHEKNVQNNNFLSQIILSDIVRYRENIEYNRVALKKSVDALQGLSTKYRVVIWGGGRIFDALVRFGGLNVNQVYMVVDKFLHRYASQINGITLNSPAELEREKMDDILVFIASRNYANEICEEASALGVKNIVRFGNAVTD